MIKNLIISKNDNYFKWLCTLIESETYDINMWMNVLEALYSKPFYYVHPKDVNRIEDGSELWTRYCEIINLSKNDNQNHNFVSILEVMIALAIRCENEIMSCIDGSNHTSIWFFDMLDSLGLVELFNENFDINEFEYITDRFLNRNYDPDGKGGLFYIPGINTDLREIEIWYQMNWYLNKKYGNGGR